MRSAVIPIPKDEQRTLRQAGASVGFSAASLTRWIEDGVKLRDGSRLRLRAVRFPVGWRTTDQWVSEFVSALTADKTSTPVRANEDSSRRANAALAATGW
jgi:hypothetical protein